MEIINIDTLIYGCPYTRPEKWRFGLRKGTTTVIIKIDTDEGLFGLGEIVCPLPPQFIQKYIRDEISLILKNQNPLNLANLRNKLLFELGFDWMVDFGGFFLAGIETALLDIIGKAYHIPAYQLLGGRIRDLVRFGSYIFSAGCDQMLDDVTSLAESGVQTFKIKINVDEDEEFRFLEKVKQKFGRAIKIAVDVNQGWKRNEAIKKIEKLDKFPILFIEQPLERNDYKGAHWLRQRSPIPIALNEGISSVQTMKTILDHQAADLLVVDILSVGGVIALKQIAGLATLNGIELIAHSGGELEIATMMMVNIILTEPGFRYDNDTYAYYLAKPIQLQINAELKHAALPLKSWTGIGCDVDFDELQSRTQEIYFSPFDQ